VLEMAITLIDAEQMFEALDKMADRISKDKEIAPLLLSYGVSIEYIKNWEKSEID
jgi:hypothetical protein